MRAVAARAEQELGEICGKLVMSGELKLSNDNIASLSADLVDMLVTNLPGLSQQNPEAALALFSRCSTRTQVAILAQQKSDTFVQAIASIPKLSNRCAAQLVAAARQATQRGNVQLLKKILTFCPLFARDRVLRTFERAGS
jgi:hypothetical protein